MKNRLYLDIHAIQVLPPSNVNRDEFGNPKSALYGGVNRSRVSSQSWKRAIREYFYENSEVQNLGVRTLKLPDYIADKMLEIDSSIPREEAIKKAGKVLKSAGISTKLKDVDDEGEKTLVLESLFFISDKQALELAQAAVKGDVAKPDIIDSIKNNMSIDIALFGRMVASSKNLNVEASCQVAHAISTHEVNSEVDYFTAVDEYTKDQGAAMIGNSNFNASTLYRYSNTAIHDLFEKIHDKETLINSIKLFIKAFCLSMPSGKISSYANQTFPSFLAIDIRSDRPMNLVSAFEEPVVSNSGYAKKSIEKLCDEHKRFNKFYDKPLLSSFISFDDIDFLNEFGDEADNLNNLAENVANFLKDNLGD